MLFVGNIFLNNKGKLSCKYVDTSFPPWPSNKQNKIELIFPLKLSTTFPLSSIYSLNLTFGSSLYEYCITIFEYFVYSLLSLSLTISFE